MKINEWSPFEDGAYKIIELIEHPIKRKTFYIRMLVAGVIKDFWRREVNNRYECIYNIYEFQINSDLNVDEISNHVLTYMKLIRDDNDSEVRKSACFKRSGSTLSGGSPQYIKSKFGIPDDIDIPIHKAY